MAVLVYWQNHAEIRAEFDTFDGALSFAAYLSAHMLAAPDRIIDGNREVSDEALSALVYDCERARGLT